jgi:8-oxo-dGTP diphosphatase
MWCEPTVLVYALRDAQVLVMHRKQEPNLGLWIAPGGKLDPGESPYEAARREFTEETGLVAQNLQLRGLCTLVPLLKQHLWFIFIFVTTEFQGTLSTDCEEGDLTWVALEEYLNSLPKPQADEVFAPKILTTDTGLFQAKFEYDAEVKLVEWIEH